MTATAQWFLRIPDPMTDEPQSTSPPATLLAKNVCGVPMPITDETLPQPVRRNLGQGPACQQSCPPTIILFCVAPTSPSVALLAMRMPAVLCFSPSKLFRSFSFSNVSAFNCPCTAALSFSVARSSASVRSRSSDKLFCCASALAACFSASFCFLRAPCTACVRVVGIRRSAWVVLVLVRDNGKMEDFFRKFVC